MPRTFADITDLYGKTFSKVTNNDDEFIDFHGVDETFRMQHHQDCCESVSIEEIHGDLSDLVGTPILEAREDSNYAPTDSEVSPDLYRSETEEWTLYNLRTIKGSVTIRWYGTSNGYYSTSVSIDRYTVNG